MSEETTAGNVRRLVNMRQVTSSTSGVQRVTMVKKTRTIITSDGQEQQETVTEERTVDVDGSESVKTSTSVLSKLPEEFRRALGQATKDQHQQRAKLPAANGSSATGAGANKQQTAKSKAEPTQEEFAKDSLRVHNEYRKKHGVGPLQLSQTLCDYALEWARKLALENKFQHRTEHKYGENLYCAWNSDPNFEPNAKDAVDSWYSEIKDHVFGAEPRSMGTGHFTQVVWKGSKEVGAAFAKGKSGRLVVVANYDPPGNLIGTYVQNVPKPN